MSLFSGLRSVSTVPAGSFVKASFVGAKTVNGPADLRVSTRPAALTAATSVVWSLELTALSTISLVGYIGAPPTIGSSIFCAEAMEALANPNATKAKTAKILFMFVSNLSSVCDWVGARSDIRDVRGEWMRREDRNCWIKFWEKYLVRSSDCVELT